MSMGPLSATTHLGLVSLTPSDLPLCARLWPDWHTFTQHQFETALDACARLLSERRAIGMLVLEGRQVRGYGMTTFVHENFADAYLAAPHPQVGKRLLLDRSLGAILHREQIADRNAHGGLQLVVVSTNYDPAAADLPGVLGLLMHAFQAAHRGYRMERLIMENIGIVAEFALTIGIADIAGVFDEATNGAKLRSTLSVLTKERALARKSPLLPMFAYNPPRVFFTPAEQELLVAALDGAPDDVISSRLGIPLSATKARWNRIHLRIAARLPGLFDTVPAPKDSVRRGPQTRHLILSFARENPAELTPYPPVRTSEFGHASA
jgi:hypothetical protein